MNNYTNAALTINKKIVKSGYRAYKLNHIRIIVPHSVLDSSRFLATMARYAIFEYFFEAVKSY